MRGVSYTRLRSLIERGFDALRSSIGRFAPTWLRTWLLRKTGVHQRALLKYLKSWTGRKLRIIGGVAALLTAVSIIHIYRVREEPPYITYEKAADGTWQIHAEYRVVESPYAYWRSKPRVGISPELQKEADEPKCKDRATVIGETAKVIGAALHAVDPWAALKELNNLELSQLVFSYFLRGRIGEAFDVYGQEVATCRLLVVDLPIGAKVGELGAAATVETVETSAKSKIGCDVYSWHKITPAHSPCGWSKVTEPKPETKAAVTEIQVIFYNWLQDRGVDRCARLSVKFVPPPDWRPDPPSGKTCKLVPPNLTR